MNTDFNIKKDLEIKRDSLRQTLGVLNITRLSYGQEDDLRNIENSCENLMEKLALELFLTEIEIGIIERRELNEKN